MKLTNRLLIAMALIAPLLLSGCSNTAKKKKPRYNNYASETAYDDPNSIAVPFTSHGDVKYVKVSVNGLLVDMIFDTGCSVNSISIAEARYLFEKGLLTKDDYRGTATGTIADGTIVEDMVFNLKDVVIADKIQCRDVLVHVSSNANAPLLLGNEINDRAQQITIDNENNLLIFKLK